MCLLGNVAFLRFVYTRTLCESKTARRACFMSWQFMRLESASDEFLVFWILLINLCVMPSTLFQNPKPLPVATPYSVQNSICRSLRIVWGCHPLKRHRMSEVLIKLPVCQQRRPDHDCRRGHRHDSYRREHLRATYHIQSILLQCCNRKRWRRHGCQRHGDDTRWMYLQVSCL